MATQYSNKPIVTDGLVYALDFGNQRSYVSGSTTANSLNYSTTTGSFYGNLNSSSLEAGLLNFYTSPGAYGNNDGTKVGFSNSAPFSSLGYGKEFTLTFLIKIHTSTLNQTILSGLSSERMGFTYEGGAYIFALNYFPDVNSYGRRYPATNNTLQYRTIRYKSGSWDHFVNGIPITASSVGVYGNPSNAGPITISGRGGLFQNMFTGSLGLIHVYNRALTSDEIWNNYQLTAPRYGLGPLQNKPYTLDENAYLFLQSAGITDPIITGSIDTFVRGLKSASLWDKMVAIYPFVGTGSTGTNLTGSHRWNLKEPSLVTYPLTFTGTWIGSTSGSAPSGSGTNITMGGVTPTTVYPNLATSSVHISILSYDTPTSSSYLMGTGMTEDLAVSTLAGDYGTPAAAYSVRKVRTAYSGALMDVRRSYDNVTSSIGYLSNGDLDTGSLLNWTIPGRNTLPGAYSGLAAAYSLRRVSASYAGSAVRVRGGIENQFRDIGFDASGNLDTGSLLNFTATGSNTLAGSYSGLAAAYSLRRVVPGYAGDAIEVQSGSVSQSIGFDSIGNLDTGSLLTFVGSGDGFVKTWYDQSGNNYHATQSVAANQPQIVSGGSMLMKYGKPNIVLTTQWLNIGTSISLGGESSIFTLLNSSTTGGVSTGIINYNSTPVDNPELRIGQGDSVNYYWNGGYVFGVDYNAGTITGGLFSLITTTGVTASLYKNSSFLISNTRSGTLTTAVQKFTIGEYLNSTRNGNISELIIYTSSQASNRTYIENNINAYYNIYTTSSTSTENAFVSTWYDQSGNNRHATQTTASSQPLIVSSGSLVTENGKPALSFNGNNRLISPTFTTITHPVTTFVAYKYTSTTNNGYGYVHSLSGNAGFLARNTSINVTSGENLFSNIVAVNNTPYLTYVLFNEANSEIKVNNNTLVTGSSGTENRVYNRIILGDGYGNDLGGALAMQGNISEFLFYSGSQASNRPLIENNINNYYNIYTGSNHGFVARWYDQSGNSRHATQTATGSQPVIVLSGSILNINSRPSLKFDGVNDSLVSSYRPATNIIAVESVQKINSASGVSVLINETGGALYLQWVNTPSTFANYYGGITNTTFSSNQLLQSFYMQSGGGGFFQNGISTVSNAQGGSGVSSLDLRIGGFDGSSLFSDSNHQELVIYQTAQSLNRQAIQYGINNYYNIYPQTSSFATSSFAIYTTSGSVSASLNNDLISGISTSGPLGLITVSRTGSNSLTIARNGVTSSFAVPASGALSTGIYLGAINNNGLALGNSPLGISFASVGTGLTGNDLTTYYRLVGDLQNNLNRPDLDATAFIGALGTLTLTQQQAVDTLVKDLKRFSLWDKTIAIYPFIGGTADTHKYNLKDPRDLDAAYRLSFSGTWTHNTSGSQPSNARANSYIIPTTALERDSVHMSFYSQTSTIGTGADWSADMNRFYFTPAIVTNNLYVTFNNGEFNTGTTPYLSSRGFLLGTRVDPSTVNYYYNNTQIKSVSVGLTSYTSTNTLLLGGFIDGRYSTNRMYSFGTVGSKLTDTDVSNLYTAVQRFQTTLGRQV